ncbi:transporter substrate-binding domain-containing protein [Enterococcus mundtii]|uniref:Amino acid ABC transporter substrate-binding protein n=1 Tax=Enterococcus mundtii TaxID=53346 RepID=A0ABQ0VAM9_ENTMU|nr:transporter substrate-binding domain-containing protein [Enterococcus mundtii]GEN16861.1 amino acid ABC transporter substrate-binding protein [Ligilactobacillus acidipiscis]AUB52179.1 amino acid ABC transporter substrate-binding protein [Enterococcus mundtii]MDB7087737.1 transporter substrate-binding domain-containing protein [Enterococcus mundtii]MZZ57679.1 transporter substrate-binding domain-containing protein [Enterococcus mundtii]MZZ60654.1 transporter substrate-binding domain-containi
MKKISGIILFLVTTFALGACGNGDAAESNDQLAEIKESGVLKVATSADYAPFEFHTIVDGKDQIVGSDIDLANAIADELGVKLELSDMSFNTVLASLKEGKVDVAISAISATAERKEQFDFTDNYYNPPQVLVINKKDEDTLTSIDRLAGKSLGAQKGSIQEAVINEQIKEAKVVTIDKVPNMVIEINQGSLDGMVVEQTIAEAYIAQNPNLMIADIPLEQSDDEAFAIALPKGSTELQEELNKIIKKLSDEGKIDEFIKKNHELAEQTATE